jgi:glycosyltransferase involved in cell wall biosynthesis
MPSRSTESDKACGLPLVTFALFAYNHERFVREAVEAALAQTYDNLEIVLSDDASTDKTYEIIQEIVANYDGPHKIILNCNEKNLGLVRHFNKVVEISSGDIIVDAASDDISWPERVEAIVKTFNSSPSNTMIVHSGGWLIDENGMKTGEIRNQFTKEYPYDISHMIKKPHHLLGATIAWRRELMTQFGPMNTDVYNEDNALLYRAVLLGQVTYTERHLVSRRMLESSMGKTMHDQRQCHLKYYQWWSALARQVLADLKTNTEVYGKYIRSARLVVARREFNYGQWEKPVGFLSALITALKLRSPGVMRQFILSEKYYRKVGSV